MVVSRGIVSCEIDELANFGDRLRSRLAPGHGERPGRPSDLSWTVQRKLSMNPKTLDALERLARHLTTSEQSVSPMQVAAMIVEDVTHQFSSELIAP